MGNFEERFLAKAQKSDDCWIWTGAVSGSGYGMFMLQSKNGKKKYVGAHRVAWLLEHGEWPKQANHICDNPVCVNPDHLFDGTQKDNIRDMVSNGRKRGGARTWTKHHLARFTQIEVNEIRRRKKIEDISYAKLALEFGVCATTVWNVVNRRHYT